MNPCLLLFASLRGAYRNHVFLFVGIGGTSHESMSVDVFNLTPTYRDHVFLSVGICGTSPIYQWCACLLLSASLHGARAASFVSCIHLHAWSYTNLSVRSVFKFVNMTSTKDLTGLSNCYQSLDTRYENNIDEFYIWQFGGDSPIFQI